MFENLSFFLRIHALVGSAALISFWIAALSRKGSPIHKSAGRIYLLSMCMVLLTSVPIVLHFYHQGDFKRALTLVYLFFVTLSAMIMLFFSIRRQASLAGYRNALYKSFAIFMTAFGLFIFSLGLQTPLLVERLLTFGFASTRASFLGLGLKKLIPVLAGDWMHTITQLSAIGLAYLLRIYLGRRMLAKISLRKNKTALTIQEN